MNQEKTMSVWKVKKESFPVKGGLKRQLKFLIRYGILAPSGHNSQPWIFKIDKNTIEIRVDLSRSRAAVDPENRELYISLGCVITNIETAAEHFQMDYKTIILPDPKQKQLAANIIFKENRIDYGSDPKLFEAITRRHTNRNRFDTKKITNNVLREIKSVNKEPELKLSLLSGQQKLELANLIEKSNIVWYKSKILVEELEKWIGQDISGKEMPNVSFDLPVDNKGIDTKAFLEKTLAAEAPVLAVISSDKDNELCWIKTGILFERLALLITKNNLKYSFFNTTTELNTSREELKIMFNTRPFPQLIFRIGYAPNGRHTPRRLLKNVILN